MRKPVIGTLKIDLQRFLGTRSDRIEEAKAFDIPAVTPVAPIRDDNVIKRTLERPTPG